MALLRSFVEYAKPVKKARALVASGETGPSAELTALNRTSTGLLLRALASAAIVLIVDRHDLEARCLSCSPPSGPTTRASRSSCTSSARPWSSARCSRARPRSLLARGETRLLRLGYFSLLLVGLPGLILLRLAGEWLYRLQNWNDLPDQFDEPAWLGIGFIVADWGGLLFLLALALGGVGICRLRNGKGGTGLLKATMVIALILIVAYVVAVWAMTGKPN